MRRGPIVGAVLATANGSLGGHLSRALAVPAAHVVSHPAGFVGVLANPTLDFVLLLAAMLAIGLEVVHPGTLVFGTLGLVAGSLAIVGLANQPVDWVGLVLVGAAAALLVVDTSLHSHGLISLAGVVAAVAGGLLLYNTSTGQGGVSLLCSDHGARGTGRCLDHFEPARSAGAPPALRYQQSRAARPNCCGAPKGGSVRKGGRRR